MEALPLWVRKFALDAITDTVAWLFVWQFAMPATLDEAVVLGYALASGIVSAAISAFRRNWPRIRAWVAGKLVVTPEDEED